MTLVKADRLRTPENVTMTPSLTAPQIESVRTRSGASGSKHSRDSEPEAETVGCYSFLVYCNCLQPATYFSGDIEEVKGLMITNSL